MQNQSQQVCSLQEVMDKLVSIYNSTNDRLYRLGQFKNFLNGRMIRFHFGMTLKIELEDINKVVLPDVLTPERYLDTFYKIMKVSCERYTKTCFIPLHRSGVSDVLEDVKLRIETVLQSGKLEYDDCPDSYGGYYLTTTDDVNWEIIRFIGYMLGCGEDSVPTLFGPEKYSYQFAVILRERFPGGTIKWPIGEPRVVYQYGNSVYDIAGASKYNKNTYVDLDWLSPVELLAIKDPYNDCFNKDGLRKINDRGPIPKVKEAMYLLRGNKVCSISGKGTMSFEGMPFSNDEDILYSISPMIKAKDVPEERLYVPSTTITTELKAD